MAFDAGSIEATLTLDRTPFNRSLRLAQRAAESFEQGRHEAELSADASGALRATQRAREAAHRYGRLRAEAELGVDLSSAISGFASARRLAARWAQEHPLRDLIQTSECGPHFSRRCAWVRPVHPIAGERQIKARRSRIRATSL